MWEIITEVAASKLLEKALDPLMDRWGNQDAAISAVSAKDPKVAILDHLRVVHRWANEISFRDLRKPRQLHRSFVNLDLHLGPPSLPNARAEREVKVSDLVAFRHNLVILGDPGAGKTTSLQRIALGLLGSSPDRLPMVLLIRLRDYADVDSFPTILLHTLGIVARFDDTVPEQHRATLERQYALRHVDGLGFTVLIDGLDEMRPGPREKIVADLRFFFQSSLRTRYLLTCRKGDYRYHLENARALTILPLSTEQIEEFATLWLGPERNKAFLNQIRNSPYSGSEVRPLTLAHLCALYEQSGRIPERPRTIYRKIVRLLLEEWDEQRSVHRVSSYSNFRG